MDDRKDTPGERAVVLNYSPVSEERLDDVNRGKKLAAAYFDFIATMEVKYGRQRDFSVAMTELQTASMWLTRGLTNPEHRDGAR